MVFLNLISLHMQLLTYNYTATNIIITHNTPLDARSHNGVVVRAAS